MAVSSPGSAASTSGSSGPDSPPHGRSRSPHTASKSSSGDSPACRATPISLNAGRTTWRQLTFLPEDFHASRSRWPESDAAQRMTVTSGRKCIALLRRSGPLGSWLRTCLVSSEFAWTTSWLIWKPKDTRRGRLYFQLAPSARGIDEIESSLLPTPLASQSGQGDPSDPKRGKKLAWAAQFWPTPTRSDGTGGPGHAGRDGGRNLRTAVALFPTPTATNTKAVHSRTGGRPPRSYLKTPTSAPFSHGGSGGELHKQVAKSGGPLNPAWVEWLMGFPIGWTGLPRSATPSSRRSPVGSPAGSARPSNGTTVTRRCR